MIKLIIELDYENVTKQDLMRAVNANDAYACIYEIKQIFRSILKHGRCDEVELTENEFNLLEKISRQIYDITSDLPGQD